MGFLKRFFSNVFHEGATVEPHSTSSFDQLSEEQIETHLQVSKYGDFELTDAIRPAYDLKVKPSQGYRHDVYVDNETQTKVPVVMASASRHELFELFMQLIERLGSEVDVVLETSHDGETAGHVDLYREHIDMPVLKSIFYEFEDLLMNDGCTGVAVLNPSIPQEVQFDEHKLLIIYGSPLEPFEHTLEMQGVPCNDNLRFVTEAEHVHSSTEEYQRQFEQLKMRLGMDSQY